MIKLTFNKIRPSSDVPYLPWENGFTPNMPFREYLETNNISVEHDYVSLVEHNTILTFSDEATFNAFEASDVVKEELAIRFKHFEENSITYTVIKQMMP